MSVLFVGPGVSLKAGQWAKKISSSGKVLLVSEPKAYGLYGKPVAAALARAGFSASVHLLPEGEKAKEWRAVESCLTAMLAAGLGRDAGLAALGGGAVTDAAGFAAAVYLRGIPWASLPTTILGQLDSGLGGKTGINLPQGKNLAGAFHQPGAVVCDTGFLKTLPVRERVSGFGEALKYGLVFEPKLFGFIRSRWEDLLAGEPGPTAEVIRRGAAWKLKVVAQDERETRGEREKLNFGHTLGHALEAVCGYGVLRHGEAVIWGMRAALRLSPGRFKEEEAFLASLPVTLPGGIKAKAVLEAARHDKKARRGKLRFILLRGAGRPFASSAVPEARILEVIEELL